MLPLLNHGWEKRCYALTSVLLHGAQVKKFTCKNCMQFSHLTTGTSRSFHLLARPSYAAAMKLCYGEIMDKHLYGGR